MTETSPGESQQAAGKPRRSIRRRLLYVAILLVALEAAGWPGRSHGPWCEAVQRFHELDTGDLLL